MREQIQTTCKMGDLIAVKWLARWLTAADVRADDNLAFRNACASGNLELVKYLVAQYGLTAADARARNNAALIGACEGNHEHLAEYLVETFGLTRSDLASEDWAALRGVCAAGNVPFARWLVCIYDLGTAMLMSGDFFAVACANGRLEMARRIGAGSIDDPPVSLFYPHLDIAPGVWDRVLQDALRPACLNGHVDVAKFLVLHILRPRTDADWARVADVVGRACAEPSSAERLEFMRWLTVHGELHKRKNRGPC
jgi:antitoxin component HigA of HigAB toxin-antitoxin module